MVDGIPVDTSARILPRTLRWPLAGSIQTCCGLLHGTGTDNPVSGCTHLWCLLESYPPAWHIIRGYMIQKRVRKKCKSERVFSGFMCTWS